MAVRGFFYNATDPNDKERRYNGKDMNEDKAPFYKEGVVFGHMAVTAGEGMMVRVDGGSRTGYAYINLHTIHNTTVLELTVGQASGTLPRIDRVVLRNDETERRPSIFILEGKYSSSPVPPELTNTDVIQEKCLAEIYVAAGAVKITQADIKDTRADTGICGFIASQFTDIDFSQLTLQFDSWFMQEKEAMGKEHEEFVEEYSELLRAFVEDKQGEWNVWFDSMKDQLSEDAAGKLLAMIEQVKLDLEETRQELDQSRKELDQTRKDLSRCPASAVIRDIQVVDALPGDAAQHPDTLYIIAG